MRLESNLIHLQAWAQGERANQGTLGKVLEQLEGAVRHGRSADLIEAGVALEVALEGNAERARQRKVLMTRFAEGWGVAAETLSLSSILERAETDGADVSRLRVLRDELREEVRAVAKRAKLLSVMAGHHRGVLQDILVVLGASSLSPEARDAGVLVDARA